MLNNFPQIQNNFLSSPLLIGFYITNPLNASERPLQRVCVWLYMPKCMCGLCVWGSLFGVSKIAVWLEAWVNNDKRWCYSEKWHCASRGDKERLWLILFSGLSFSITLFISHSLTGHSLQTYAIWAVKYCLFLYWFIYCFQKSPFEGGRVRQRNIHQAADWAM